VTTPQVAAEELLGQLAIPPGLVSIWPWREKEGVVLRVLVDPVYRGAIKNLPARFRGYRTSLETRTLNEGLQAKEPALNR
jgi:hypothetical protein